MCVCVCVCVCVYKYTGEVLMFRKEKMAKISFNPMTAFFLHVYSVCVCVCVWVCVCVGVCGLGE